MGWAVICNDRHRRLKRVLAKTGLSRQSELVSLLASVAHPNKPQ